MHSARGRGYAKRTENGGEREFLMKKKRQAKKRGKKSIYFLLWASFTAFSLAIVLVFGFFQSRTVRETYARSAAEDTVSAGNSVKREVEKKQNKGEAIGNEFLFEQSSANRVKVAELSVHRRNGSGGV